jgi:hypothetical protein
MANQGQVYHQTMVASLTVAARGTDMAEDAKFLCNKALQGRLTLYDQKVLYRKLLNRAREGLELSREVERRFVVLKEDLLEVDSCTCSRVPYY